MKNSEPIFPDNASIFWFLNNAPVKWLLPIAVTIFSVGVIAGQTDIIKQLMRIPTQQETYTPKTPEEYKTEIQKLVGSHESSMTQLHEAIVAEEKEAGKSHYSIEKEPHIEAANRLRQDIEKERLEFRKSLDALRNATGATLILD